MGFIYKITNIINGKIYIGQTISEKVERRWEQHRYRLTNKIHNNSYLQRSWHKYGKKNFEFEILEEINDIEELNKREKFLIKELKSHKKCGKGYNLRSGGKNFKHSEETKRKMSEAQLGEKNHMYGKSVSKETRKRIAKASSQRIQTEETKSKIGRKVKKYYENNPNPRSKKVIQMNLNGDKINEFNSVRGAERETEINSSHISKVCRGIRKTAGNFKWRYKNG